MFNYSMVNLKHSSCLRRPVYWVYKDVIYSQNTGFRQKGNRMDPSFSMWGKLPHVSVCKFSFLGHRSQRLQWPIVITRCPSSVCRPLDNLHFQLLLQNRLMDFDETWYGWSTQSPLQVMLFFGQIHPGADPGRGQIRSRGSTSTKNFFFGLEG